MKFNIIVYRSIAFSTCLALILASCKKFVDVPLPIDQITSETVFTNDETATQAISGIYSLMMDNPEQFSTGKLSLLTGMCADDLYHYSPGYQDEFVNNQITESSHGIISAVFWDALYKYIYVSNLCIERLSISGSLSPQVKSRLIGESKFIRAFCYFHLVNLFGAVPMPLKSDYSVSANLPRTAPDLVFQQVLSDLLEAEQLIPISYSQNERVRPNKMGVKAMLARVYLYLKEWPEAEAQADAVVNSGLYSLETITAVFQKQSRETLWQLKPVNPSYSTWEGFFILPRSATETPKYLVSQDLVNTFEPGDLRLMNWVGSRVYLGELLHYPAKYKEAGGFSNPDSKEYYVVFRLTEMHLIRAEARLHNNKTSGALLDLNLVRSRSGLQDIQTTDKDSLAQSIEHERRVEFFSEWGHRWFDLKRTNRIDIVLAAFKPLTWQSTDRLWPVPFKQIQANPLLTQNPGY